MRPGLVVSLATRWYANSARRPLMKIRVLRTIREKLPLWDDKSLKDIPFFSTDVIRHRAYIAAMQGQKIVGMACVTEDSMRIPGALGVSFVSTHPDHRNQGIAKQLVQALFEFARSERKGIANTAYEPDGEAWLRHVFARQAQAFPDVAFYER